jgi:hypothetical protein
MPAGNGLDVTIDWCEMGIDVTSKARALVRQQYLVSKRNVGRLREMSSDQGVSVDDLVSRAIDAYTAGSNAYSRPAEHRAAEALLAATLSHVEAAFIRMNALVAEACRRQHALRNPALRVRVRQETRRWFASHPREAQAITDVLAPPL